MQTLATYKNLAIGAVLTTALACAGPGTESAMSRSTLDSAASSSGALANWEEKPFLIGKGSGPQLLMKASEGMSLLYAAMDETGKQNLMYQSSHNIGDTFSKPYRVNSEPGEVSSHGENNPLLRPGAGIGMFAAWDSGKDIKFSRSMNFGRSFTPAIQVNDEGAQGYHSFQTMEVGPDGTIYAIWLDGRDKDSNIPGSSSLYLGRSTDRGATFEKNIRIAGDVCPCCRPAIAFDEKGKVFATWRTVHADNNRVVVVASSEDKGVTWSTATPVTADGWKINGCPHSGPSMAYADGTLFLAWYTGATNEAVLRAARSSDGGKSFEVIEGVQGAVLDANHPDLQMINGDAWAIFQGRDPDSKSGWGVTEPWLVKIPAKGSVSAPQKVPSLGGSVSYPLLHSGAGGRIYATWTELTDEGPLAVLCRGRLAIERP